MLSIFLKKIRHEERNVRIVFLNVSHLICFLVNYVWNLNTYYLQIECFRESITSAVTYLIFLYMYDTLCLMESMSSMQECWSQYLLQMQECRIYTAQHYSGLLICFIIRRPFLHSPTKHDSSNGVFLGWSVRG